MVKVEYKVKRTKGVAWENLPVAVTIGIESPRYSRQVKDAIHIGLAIVDGNPGCEIRWNFEGSYQGHYCGRIA